MTEATRIGSINWPAQVLDYAASTGRIPEESCPLIEDRAVSDAGEILPYVDHLRGCSMLDIGCGLALVDVMLAREIAPRCVYLLDGAEPGAHDAGYKALMQPWAEAAVGAQVFRANASPSIRLFTLAPMPFQVEVDLIISTRSWGHHYPVGVYLASVVRSLRPGGVLAVDLRTGKGGREEIEAAGFGHVATIDQRTRKCDRVIFKRLG